MVKNTPKNIKLPKSLIKKKEGVVILPLKKWKKIEQNLEDLEMYRSESLPKEIEKSRKEKETVPLEKLLKKHRI